MHTLGTIYTFKTKNFLVRVTAEEEDSLDLSWDEDGRVRAGLASGELIAFCVHAQVFWRGHLVGEDYLGECIYESIEAFRDHLGIREYSRQESAKLGRDVCAGSYFSDMIRTCVTEARKTLASMRGARLRPPKGQPPSLVLVHVEGGVIQSVKTDDPNIQVMVVDDDDESEPARIEKIYQADVDAAACAALWERLSAAGGRLEDGEPAD
jgi:hypothetical protein